MTTDDEEVEEVGFDAARWSTATASAPTREVALLVLERCILETNIPYSCNELVQKVRDSINKTWDRKDEEAREPHGPRLPMTQLDYNTVNTVRAYFKQLPFTVHILWYPRTQVLGCIFDDVSLMIDSPDQASRYKKIFEMLEGNDLGVRAIRHIPYSTDGPANAPFEIAEEWLQENGYWFFRG
jgi:hypothetical protein